MSVSLEVRNFCSLQRMLEGLSLVSIRECSDGRQCPNPLIPVATLSVAPFVEADIDCFASTPTIIRLAIAKQACKFPAAHTVHSWTPCSSFPASLCGVHLRMLDGLSLVSIRECSMDASGPIQVPSSCVRDIHFSELRFVEADIG